MQMRIAGFVQESIVDGPGWRLVVFCQGCPHGCKGCHNPHTHDFNGGWMVDTSEIIGMMDANPLLDGITLSGGEPLFQMAACRELAKAAHERGLNVWCYTGFTWDAVLEAQGYISDPPLNYIDVLVDGPFIESQKSLELQWRGSKNQRLIDVQKSLRKHGVVEWKP